jgi:hypothetical protein
VGYPKAEYANFVRISHSPTELVLDFACLLPAPLDPSNPAGQPHGEPGSRICARVMMSPLGAKLLYRALGDNLARYEAAFGEIPMPGDPNLVSDLFRGARPPEPPKPGEQKPDPE